MLPTPSEPTNAVPAPEEKALGPLENLLSTYKRLKNARNAQILRNWDLPDSSETQARDPEMKKTDFETPKLMKNLSSSLVEFSSGWETPEMGTREICEECAKCVDIFEKVESLVKRRSVFDMRDFVSHGLETMGAVSERRILELFGVICARYLESVAKVRTKLFLIESPINCLKAWLVDYVMELESKVVGLIHNAREGFIRMSMVNEDFLKELRKEVDHDSSKRCNVDQAASLYCAINEVNNLVRMIPTSFSTQVIDVGERDPVLIERIDRFVEKRLKKIDQEKQTFNMWILPSIEGNIENLAELRAAEMSKAKEALDETAPEEKRGRFRAFELALDAYMTVAPDYDKLFASQLAYVFRVMFITGGLVPHCTLPSLPLLLEGLKITKLSEEIREYCTEYLDIEKKNQGMSLSSLLKSRDDHTRLIARNRAAVFAHARAALKVITEYQSVLSKYNDATDDWPLTKWNLQALNCFLSLLKSNCISFDDGRKLITMIFNDPDRSHIVDIIPALNLQECMDVYFQLSEFLLVLAEDIELSKHCNRLRSSMIRFIECGENCFKEFDRQWQTFAAQDADILEYRDVYSMMKTVNDVCVFLMTMGETNLQERIQTLFIVTTMININRRLTTIGRAPVIEIEELPFLADKMGSINEWKDMIGAFISYFSEVQCQDIRGKQPEQTEEYVLGFCNLQLQRILHVFTKFCAKIPPGYQPRPAQTKFVLTRSLDTYSKMRSLVNKMENYRRKYPHEDLPQLRNELRHWNEKLNRVTDEHSLNELYRLAEEYTSTKAVLREVNETYIQVKRSAIVRKYEIDWSERKRETIESQLQAEMEDRRAAIQKANEEAEKFDSFGETVAQQLIDIDDLERAEHLVEARKQYCVTSITQQKEVPHDAIAEIYRETAKIVTENAHDRLEMEKLRYSRFDEALKLVDTVQCDRVAPADEEEARSLMIADNERQIETLNQMLAYVRGESRSREELGQFISVPRPKGACSKGKFEETQKASRDVLNILIGHRKELIEKEGELMDRMRALTNETEAVSEQSLYPPLKFQ